MLRFVLLLISLLLSSACGFTVAPKSTSSVSLWSSSTEGQPTTAASTTRSSTDRIAVIICPAQFCVPDDYHVLAENLAQLQHNVTTCRVAPLPRTEWIKVAKQLPTRAFLEAKLPVKKTLDWYFQAIETALAEIFSTEGPDVKICFIGHSIGGWVARAYLGGLSGSSTAVHHLAMQQCTSLITLGTPHTSPEGALVDQTRGLLREIAESPSCCPQALSDRGIAITCVCSQSLGGSFLTTNIEEIVAASSYLPLTGRLDAQGDGIVPTDLAFMDEPARRVILDNCSLTQERIRHSHVLPTPWNLIDGSAKSIVLPDEFPSYVSPGVISQWAKYIQ